MRTVGAATSSISDLAYADLARAIETCALAPGTPINERAEASRLGMSRTPFRQALHRLALDGLIVAVPKRGTYVAPLDARDIRDNMAVRTALEVDVVCRLVDEAHEVDLGLLDACLEDQERAAKSGDWLSFLGLDEAFHMALMKAAGNRRATESARRAWMHINRARYLTPLSTEQMGAALKGHGEIMAALRSADATAVRVAIARHLGEPLSRRLEELRESLADAFKPIPA